ncbi:MAG: succinate dehydrogenase, hydrophobic membrane anchor protein [Methylococcaceae bacterium]|nr:MAG: succinate dehydrogenase, hydrophobic membrane anchor protein [Methylococcaceae bacterium]
MNYRSALGKARGLGSAKGGSRHWWAQRVTALALIPLVFWLAVAVSRWPAADYGEFIRWVTAPWNTILLISFIIAAFYHAMLGVQVVIEDYVHSEGIKILSILSMKLILAFLALASVFATLRIAFTG